MSYRLVCSSQAKRTKFQLEEVLVNYLRDDDVQKCEGNWPLV